VFTAAIFTKFSQLINRKIIKIVATICQILRLKCTKFNFGWGSAPDPAGGAYSAPPDPLAGFNGRPTSKGRGGRGEEGKGRGMGAERKGRNEKGTHSGLDPVPYIFLRIYAHGHIRRMLSAMRNSAAIQSAVCCMIFNTG